MRASENTNHDRQPTRPASPSSSVAEVAKRSEMTASQKAARTGRWAVIMTKWAVSFSKPAKRWQIVDFPGPSGRESRGVVDLVALRRDHHTNDSVFKRGDLFELMLIQVKGGNAAWPSKNDVRRLRAVARRYGAKETILAEWKKGRRPAFYTLANTARRRRGDDVWCEVDDPRALFR